MSIARILTVLLMLMTALRVAPANAQESATAPASQAAADVEQMTIIVAEVVGLVQVRNADDDPWQKVVEGMELSEGAEFRTGPRSSVTCVIPPDQSFTLDRLGTVKIAEALRTGGKVRTDLIMKYGRTRYDIEAAGLEHDATIRSPSSTLAVRGTRVQLYDQPPFTPRAASFTGAARFGYAKKSVAVGGKSYAAVAAGKNGAAETSLDDSVVDPRYGPARSQSDAQLIANETSRGGIAGFDPITNIATITGGDGPLPDSSFPAAAPGSTSFVLRWTGNADVNLLVTNQAGDQLAIIFGGYQPTEILFPGFNLDQTRSGGRIPFDHRGGKNGGQEFAYWNTKSPEGVYGVSAIHASGETANFKINVYKDGEAQSIFTTDADFNIFKQTTLNGTVSDRESVSGIVLLPRNDLFEQIAIPIEVTGPVPESRRLKVQEMGPTYRRK